MGVFWKWLSPTGFFQFCFGVFRVLTCADDPELTATLGMDSAPGDISVGTVVRRGWGGGVVFRVCCC